MVADAGPLTWTWPWRAWLDAAIGREVARLRARYELTLDEFRGVYVSDEQVDALLASHAPQRTRVARPAIAVPLTSIRDAFALDDDECATVFVLFALELDAKYEALYAYLNDDASRRYATIDLCLRLTGAPRWSLEAGSTLFTEGLIAAVPAGPAAPWRSAGVTLADPVRRHLLGVVDREASACALPSNTVLVGNDRAAAARRLAADANRPLLEVPDEDALRDTLLAARLRGACVFVDLDLLSATALRTAIDAPVPVLFGASNEPWRRRFEGVDHDVVRLTPPPTPDRAHCWRHNLRAHAITTTAHDVDEIAALFALSPAQIDRATARLARTVDGHADHAALAAAARAESNVALEELAVRVPPVFGWDDLVLPEPTLQRLREFAAAIRARDQVFRDWGFLRASGGSASLRALFSGASGTGKTMSASVIASEIGLDLYRIDLSAVVSKYIGETEKNLERIFQAAEGSNAILFFDEADALFGKRSEVKDAHDRYANIEVAYLLQRMETYDGVLILATNLAKHIDEAFSRRIHVEIDFPLPDEAQRARLWRQLVPAQAPTSPDVDYEFLARQFPLTGGEIRNVALAAGFLAAYEHSDLAMHHLVRAVARQRRKQGKLPIAAEFKHYLAAVHADGA